MRNMKATDNFFDAVEKNGLNKAFAKISNIASDTLNCFLEDIVDDFVADQERPVCRIRYCESDREGHEVYIFEIRQHDEQEFGFMCSFRLIDDRLSYQALTKIREMMKLGYDIYFK